MPKSQEQFNAIKEERKQHITNCALKIFCKKGHNACTINDIVKEAKCSHGLFYHYFKNKKEVFDAVCEARGLHMIDFLDKVMAQEDNYLNKLKKMTEYTFQNMQNDQIFAYRYYFFLSTVFYNAENNILPPKDKVPPHVKMHSFFEEGIRAGDFTDKYPACECTKLYNAIIQGTTLNFILCPNEFKQKFKFPSVQFILDIFKKGDN